MPIGMHEVAMLNTHMYNTHMHIHMYNSNQHPKHRCMQSTCMGPSPFPLSLHHLAVLKRHCLIVLVPCLDVNLVIVPWAHNACAAIEVLNVADAL